MDMYSINGRQGVAVPLLALGTLAAEVADQLCERDTFDKCAFVMRPSVFTRFLTHQPCNLALRHLAMSFRKGSRG